MSEVWEDISGYEGLYQVSTFGNVKALTRSHTFIGQGGRPHLRTLREKPVTQHPSQYGYWRVYLCKEGKVRAFFVHRLVALAFWPNPESKPVVNHINGIKTDNRVNNLVWNTVLENSQHAISTGLTKLKGQDNPNSLLTESEVLKVCRLLDEGELSYPEIGRLFNVRSHVVSAISRGELWDWLTHRSSSRTIFGKRSGANHRQSRPVINCRGQVFQTVRSAADAFNLVGWSKISAACRGTQHTAGKYSDGSPVKWRYYVD